MTNRDYTKALTQLPAYEPKQCDMCPALISATFCNGETLCADCVSKSVFND